MEQSKCCDAKIILTDICSKCKEHDDILQCDGCKKDGSFYGNDYHGGDLPQLYSMLDLENGIYCNDCIPEWWAEKLESKEHCDKTESEVG